jgi:peroxin-3
LTYFAGVFGTFYLVSSYTLDRMREARMRALKDRKNKDL